MDWTLVEAPWILPIATPAIADGAVLLDGTGVVVAVGPRRRLQALAPLGAGRAFAGAVVLPALVNAHVHLELSVLAGELPGGRGLPAWVAALLEKRPALEAPRVRAAVARAGRELHASGTGAIGDVSSGLAGSELAADVPLRGVRFHEALAVDPTEAAAALEAARERAARSAGPLRSALAAHSPATCSAELLALVARASAGAPVSVHLAEDAAERELLERGSGAWAELLRARGLAVPRARGLSPVAALERAGLLGPRTLAIHGVDLDDGDIGALASSGTTVVLCPRSNRYLGVGRAPLEKLVAARVPLALGTDSLGSSPSLALLEEAAALGGEPRIALEAATLGGARALGLAAMGSLEPGQRPGVIALDVAVGQRRPEAAVLEQPRAPLTWLAPVTPALERVA